VQELEKCHNLEELAKKVQTEKEDITKRLEVG
jgi:hypothetical protein